MDEYSVAINGKEYLVRVEKNNRDMKTEETAERTECATEKTSDARTLFLETAKAEYDYCQVRSEKLDNKIYILLTVCAFLFTVLIQLIMGIASISFPKTICQLLAIIGFSILLVLSGGSVIWTLLTVLPQLKGIQMERVSTTEIREAGCLELTAEQYSEIVSGQYDVCAQRNNKEIEKGYDVFNRSVKGVLVCAVSLICAAIVQIIL